MSDNGTNYYRITGYCEKDNFSFIMDSSSVKIIQAHVNPLKTIWWFPK